MHIANEPRMPKGHIALRIFCLLRSGGDRVKSDISEKHYRSTSYDAAPTELPGPSLGGIKAPVGLPDVTQFALLT